MKFTYSGPVVADDGDFLALNKHKPKFVAVCSCIEKQHPNHPKKNCEVVVERDFVSSKKGYNCFDCKRFRAEKKNQKRIEEKREYDRKYKRSLFSFRFTKEERKTAAIWQEETDPRFMNHRNEHDDRKTGE